MILKGSVEGSSLFENHRIRGLTYLYVRILSPIITCSIGLHTFRNAICDLGSTINIMSKETYDRLFYTTLAPNSVYLQLADQSTRYLEGVATDLLVKESSAYVPTDFMILDMGNDKDTPLILGRPFPSYYKCLHICGF